MTPAALGAGYVVFFLYSTIIGIFAIVLAFIVASKQTALQARQKAAIEEEAVIAATEGQPS